jgi:indolepyruvate decarboxylase
VAPAELCAAVPAPSEEAGPLTQTAFWQQIQEFLRPDDLVVADLGTSFWGAALCRMPAGAHFLGQVLWGSIGYGVPAAFGAQLAAPERRCLLLVGDGAAQLTAQEIGSMIRAGQRPIIFLLNNSGYTIERLIRGPHQRYNDIASWDLGLLPAGLGGGGRTLTLRAGTPSELSDALLAADEAEQLVLIEVLLDRLDAPDALRALADSVADAMA